MDFLRGHATASAIGLFVICRYLSAYAEGRSEEELRQSLQVLRVAGQTSDDAGPVLAASLAVGEAVGILSRDSTTAAWSVDAKVAGVLSVEGDQWPRFRGELLRRISAHGLGELQASGKVPDLVAGLTWFLQLDPLRPLPTAWTAPTEPLVRAGTLDAVSRSEQWRPFQRWAVALGLARQSNTGSAKVLIPDATTAIADQIPSMPTSGSAHEWLAVLRERLPVLGSTTLLGALPTGGPPWDELPSGLMLGLLKLEKAGALSLEASDDASHVVSIGLGVSTRQVGRIAVTRSVDA